MGVIRGVEASTASDKGITRCHKGVTGVPQGVTQVAQSVSAQKDVPVFYILS